MANKLYPKYRAALISNGGGVDLIGGSVKIIMVDTSLYTYADSHEFLSDVPGGAQVAITGALTSKSVTSGSGGATFTSATARATAVTGTTVSALIGFIDTGSPSTSRLVWFDDTSITGLPVTPSGASYNIVPDSTGWFVL